MRPWYGLLLLLLVACTVGAVQATPTPLPPFSPPLEGDPVSSDQQEGEQVLFAVIGDYGAGTQAEADVAALVKSWQPEFIITLGDNNYPSGSAESIDRNIGQYYHEYIGNYMGDYGEGSLYPRFFPVMGNHDWGSQDGQPYLDYFTLPGNERYYDFIWGPVHFFALDSDWHEPDGVNRSSAQAQWLQQRLAQAGEPWKIVYFHHPPYSSSKHGSIDWMQWPFAEWGADAVLAGHDHTYERLEIDGIPYFVNGLGGASIYTFGGPLSGSQARFSADYGAMRVTADEWQITFEFITRGGEVVDEYVLSKLPLTVEKLPEPDGYTWSLVGQGFVKPVAVVAAPGQAERLYVVEQAGVIRILENGATLPTPFLDIRDRVGSDGTEQGLLGLAFHPQYVQNGYFFVNYTDKRGDTVIARYRVSADLNLADPTTEEVVLTLDQPFANHNGGHLLFGPDGYLYIGTGDGGLFGDPQDRAQDRRSLLGKMLRIDVSELPYRIPEGNPFGDEIWALGLRNPWRYAFDPFNGDLYLADVGQDAWEEVNYLPADAPPGANFGWDYYEGSHPYAGAPSPTLSLVFPVAEYGHDQGCSVTGGVVYRGLLAEWRGVYLYGDYCTGRIWGLLKTDEGEWLNDLLFETAFNISTFGQDAAGEVYLADHSGGGIYRLSTAP